jgi:STE24 endopeptidase
VGGRGESLASIDALARFLFFAQVIGVVIGPVLASLSRSREWSADDFAVAATRAPESGVAAFRRLSERNLSEDEQPRWMELLFSSHPSLRARIDALEGAAQ